MKKTHCKGCGAFITLRPQTPHQRFCSLSACQKERKRLWQQKKRQTDADYKANEKMSRHRPGYWKAYRQRNPAYVKRNRALQKIRDGYGTRPHDDLATEDASTVNTPLKSGVYEVILFSEKSCNREPVNPENLYRINVIASHL